MLNEQQIEAIQAAIDVAYDGTPSDDKVRLEMEDHARTGFEYIKTAAQAPRPGPSRWKVLTTATKSTGILMCIKTMIGVDPYRRVVVMPEVDYKRVMARMANLERVALERKAKIADLENELDKGEDDGTSGQDVSGRSDAGEEDGVIRGGNVPQEVQPDGVRDVAGEGAGDGEGQAPRLAPVAGDSVDAGSVVLDAGEGQGRDEAVHHESGGQAHSG